MTDRGGGTNTTKQLNKDCNKKNKKNRVHPKINMSIAMKKFKESSCKDSNRLKTYNIKTK